MTSCAQKLLLRGGSFSENFTFLDLRCEQMLNEKKCQTTKQSISQRISEETRSVRDSHQSQNMRQKFKLPLIQDEFYSVLTSDKQANEKNFVVIQN